MADPNRPATGYPAPNPNVNGYSTYPAPPPAGTAYPYAAGVPPSNPPYFYQNNPYYQPAPDPDSVRRATWLRRIFAIVIGVVIIFGTITFIVWLVLRPQLPEFRVDAFSVSNFTLSNDSVTSFTSEIQLTARNPNKKMTLSYDQIRAMIFYQSTSLSETSVVPFSQGTKNETSLGASFMSASSFVDSSVVNAINAEKGRNGNLAYNFRMVSRIKFEVKAWRTRKRSLMVLCSDLKVSIPSNGSKGTLTNGPKRCRVGI